MPSKSTMTGEALARTPLPRGKARVPPKRQTAIHEAGHAVIGRVLGMLCRPSIERVAAALLERKTVQRDEIDALLPRVRHAQDT
jgi:hypothetical protein